MEITIYHKPSCSKSCEVLQLIKGKKIKPTIINYIENPPTKKELKELLKKLGMKAEELVRKKEHIYKDNFEGKKFTEAQWIEILIKNPVLIERPIVVKGDKAIIVRPNERLAEILG
ncbi:MAG: arsenate reductase (glutaredoxin) [Bacteroidia bacterium]|nr:arsenate reductase (glutaredoxin) [Bacteroidia bacterium]